MYVEITTCGSGPAMVGLCDLDDLARFSVRIDGDCTDDLIESALAASGAGHRDGKNVVVSVDWLRRCTRARPMQWQDSLERMLDYAASRGWMDVARVGVTAHIEIV
jgi:hypothetical protein